MNAFFEKIGDIIESRGISKDVLFQCAPELFEVDALIYFRSIRDQAKCKDDIISLFREEFFRDGNKNLFEQIKARTQGNEESIAIYVAKMQCLFNRLSFNVK